MIPLVLLVCVAWFLAGALVALAVGQAARDTPTPDPLIESIKKRLEQDEFEAWLTNIRPGWDGEEKGDA